MRWPWQRTRPIDRLHAVRREIDQQRRELEQDWFEIGATKPIVEEAIKRTNDRFIAVEEARRQTLLECALVRVLTEGWNG